MGSSGGNLKTTLKVKNLKARALDELGTEAVHKRKIAKMTPPSLSAKYPHCLNHLHFVLVDSMTRHNFQKSK